MVKRRVSKKSSSKRKKKRSMTHLNAWRKHLAECHAKMGGTDKVSLKDAMKRCSKTYKKSGSKKKSSNVLGMEYF